MSNALAIATVTETLLVVLGRALPHSLINNSVARALAPDDPFFTAATRPPVANLFLYQVSPNTAWRNADLPTRRADGTLVRRPQLALDLHYLITFYGDNTTREPQRMLGAVARELHANPVLSRADVTTAEAVTDPSGVLYAKSDLSDQIDLVRVTPINFSLEEMSKLWSVFLKTDYALSVAYAATVLLIETDDPEPATAPPVRDRAVFAVPMAMPVLESVDPSMPEFAAGLTIKLRGKHLDAAGNVVRIDEVPPDLIPAGAPAAHELIIAVPGTLRAGVHQLRVLQSSPLGAGHVSSQSNPAFFVLRPKLGNVTFGGGVFTATVSPKVADTQKVSLLLNPTDGSAADPLTLAADTRTGDTDTLVFDPAPAHVTVPAGTRYLARIRVDDAESLLAGGGFGPAPAYAPAPYTGPTVAVP